MLISYYFMNFLGKYKFFKINLKSILFFLNKKCKTYINKGPKNGGTTYVQRFIM